MLLQVTALEDRTVPSGGQGGDPPSLSPPIVAISYDVAEEQSFAASIGVGLLNNYSLGSFGSGTAVQSIQLPGSSTTYSTGTPITTTGGGTLTVGSNGSFSFIPGSTQSGADTFQFNISDGTNSGYGTTTLYVGGSGSNYGPNDLAAAPAGTLTFHRTSTSPAFSDDFVVHDVPFHLATNGASGVLQLGYQLFIGELAHVEDEATVPLLENVVTYLHSSLWDFTFADGQELAKHIVHVRQSLDVAIGDINGALLGGYIGSEMVGPFNRWFKGNGTGAGYAAPTEQQASTIFGRFQDVASNLDTKTIKYENHQADPAYRGYWGMNVGGVIGIGPLYFSGPAKDKFGTVIHELCHSVTGDDDYAYFKNPDSLDPENGDVQWEDPNNWLDEFTRAPITVTTADLINNPDSYAGFLTEYYY